MTPGSQFQGREYVNEQPEELTAAVFEQMPELRARSDLGLEGRQVQHARHVFLPGLAA